MTEISLLLVFMSAISAAATDQCGQDPTHTSLLQTQVRPVANSPDVPMTSLKDSSYMQVAMVGEFEDWLAKAQPISLFGLNVTGLGTMRTGERRHDSSTESATIGSLFPDGQYCFDQKMRQADRCDWHNSDFGGSAQHSLDQCEHACSLDDTCVGIQHKGLNCDFIREPCDFVTKYASSPGTWHIKSKECFASSGHQDEGWLELYSAPVYQQRKEEMHLHSKITTWSATWTSCWTFKDIFKVESLRVFTVAGCHVTLFDQAECRGKSLVSKDTAIEGSFNINLVPHISDAVSAGARWANNIVSGRLDCHPARGPR